MAEEQVLIPVPLEEVLGQLITRGWESGFTRSPVKEFKGRLAVDGGITGNMVTPRNAKAPKLQVTLTFSDLEVITTDEPYMSAIMPIELLVSNREQSGWGVLGGSIDKILNGNLPADAPADALRNMRHCLGKQMHLKYTPGHMMWDVKAAKEMPRNAWEVIWIEGETGVVGSSTATIAAGITQPPPMTPLTAQPQPQPQQPVQPPQAPVLKPVDSKLNSIQRSLVIADGKNLASFKTEAFKDPVVRVDGKIVGEILGDHFFDNYINSGVITKDSAGVMHLDKTSVVTIALFPNGF